VRSGGCEPGGGEHQKHHVRMVEVRDDGEHRIPTQPRTPSYFKQEDFKWQRLVKLVLSCLSISQRSLLVS